MITHVTRRGFFDLFAAPLRRAAEAAKTQPPVASAPAAVIEVARVAVIQGRFCLAYRSICSVCSERCPVPGAITVERGIPIVNSAICTGCGICHQVCPAPKNAILQIPRRPMPDYSKPQPA